MKLSPFASKELPELQKKLFRRHYGVETTLVPNSDSVIIFTIPHAWCKITTVEIVGAPYKLLCDFEVLDSVAGTYTTIPNYVLNKFGFNVNIAKDFYKDHSEYDADLYAGMQLRVTLKNPGTAVDNVGLNIILHEVVSA